VRRSQEVLGSTVRFQGAVALHGPFIGMEYAHVDHLIRDAVIRRLDMTLDAAVKLRAARVVLHSGYRAEVDLFDLRGDWLERSTDFWQREIHRWADARIEVVLENDIDKSPDFARPTGRRSQQSLFGSMPGRRASTPVLGPRCA